MTTCLCKVKKCVLCEGQFFDGLNPAQVCEIQGMINKRVYQQGDILFEEGEPSDFLLMLKTGYVKLSTTLTDGRQQILRIAVACHLLGFEPSGDHQHPVTAEAVSTVETCEIKHDDMLRVLEKNPAVSMRVIQVLNEQLERSEMMIRDLGIKSATERVASFIVSLVPTRSIKPPIESLLPLTRQEMGNLLGLSVETVSRLMAKFRRDGLVEEGHGHIHIKDYAALLELTGTNEPLNSNRLN